MNEYYIYKWYIISTGEIFYVGKGKGKRCYDVIHSRNELFKNIINKHVNDTKVDFLYENLTEEEAFKLERQIIKEYWDNGLCRANFHEGGCGGNTGKYNDKERSKKLSMAAKKRVGKLNPMYGKTHSEEVRKILSEKNKGKRLSEEHKEKLIKANSKRKKTVEEIERIRNLNLGKKMPKERYDKMMDKVCKYSYEIFLDNKLIYECLGHTKLYEFCKNELNISRTIVDKIITKNWSCKFNRHKHLNNIEIHKIFRGVTTNGDECSHVG